MFFFKLIINQKINQKMYKRQFQDDSDFSVKKYYRRRLIKKKRSKAKGNGSESQFQQTSGKWNLLQTKLYVQFLKINKEVINDLKYRRQMKIFKQMSLFIRTRTPDQCRSHHQKVQKLHKYIDDIIKFYQRKVLSGVTKRMKIQQNIVLIRGCFQKGDKTTTLIETQDFFNYQIEQQKISITIKEFEIAQY